MSTHSSYSNRRMGNLNIQQRVDCVFLTTYNKFTFRGHVCATLGEADKWLAKFSLMTALKCALIRLERSLNFTSIFI